MPSMLPRLPCGRVLLVGSATIVVAGIAGCCYLNRTSSLSSLSAKLRATTPLSLRSMIASMFTPKDPIIKSPPSVDVLPPAASEPIIIAPRGSAETAVDQQPRMDAAPLPDTAPLPHAPEPSATGTACKVLAQPLAPLCHRSTSTAAVTAASSHHHHLSARQSRPLPRVRRQAQLISLDKAHEARSMALTTALLPSETTIRITVVKASPADCPGKGRPTAGDRRSSIVICAADVAFPTARITKRRPAVRAHNYQLVTSDSSAQLSAIACLPSLACLSSAPCSCGSCDRCFKAALDTSFDWSPKKKTSSVIVPTPSPSCLPTTSTCTASSRASSVIVQTPSPSCLPTTSTRTASSRVSRATCSAECCCERCMDAAVEEAFVWRGNCETPPCPADITTATPIATQVATSRAAAVVSTSSAAAYRSSSSTSLKVHRPRVRRQAQLITLETAREARSMALTTTLLPSETTIRVTIVKPPPAGCPSQPAPAARTSSAIVCAANAMCPASSYTPPAERCPAVCADAGQLVPFRPSAPATPLSAIACLPSLACLSSAPCSCGSCDRCFKAALDASFDWSPKKKVPSVNVPAHTSSHLPAITASDAACAPPGCCGRRMEAASHEVLVRHDGSATSTSCPADDIATRMPGAPGAAGMARKVLAIPLALPRCRSIASLEAPLPRRCPAPQVRRQTQLITLETAREARSTALTTTLLPNETTIRVTVVKPPPAGCTSHGRPTQQLVALPSVVCADETMCLASFDTPVTKRCSAVRARASRLVTFSCSASALSSLSAIACLPSLTYLSSDPCSCGSCDRCFKSALDASFDWSPKKKTPSFNVPAAAPATTTSPASPQASRAACPTECCCERCTEAALDETLMWHYDNCETTPCSADDTMPVPTTPSVATARGARMASIAVVVPTTTTTTSLLADCPRALVLAPSAVSMAQLDICGCASSPSSPPRVLLAAPSSAQASVSPVCTSAQRYRYGLPPATPPTHQRLAALALAWTPAHPSLSCSPTAAPGQGSPCVRCTPTSAVPCQGGSGMRALISACRAAMLLEDDPGREGGAAVSGGACALVF